MELSLIQDLVVKSTAHTIYGLDLPIVEVGVVWVLVVVTRRSSVTI